MSRKKLTKYDIKIHDRIKETRIYYHYTLTAFAKSLGFSQSYISEVENQKTKPSLVLLYQISENTTINLHWLFTGEGKMLREKSTNEAYPENSPDKDPESDLVAKTIEILKSKSIYKAALTSNINAFHSSFKTQETMNKRVATMEKQIAKLIKNRQTSDSS